MHSEPPPTTTIKLEAQLSGCTTQQQRKQGEYSINLRDNELRTPAQDNKNTITNDKEIGIEDNGFANVTASTLLTHDKSEEPIRPSYKFLKSLSYLHPSKTSSSLHPPPLLPSKKETTYTAKNKKCASTHDKCTTAAAPSRPPN